MFGIKGIVEIRKFIYRVSIRSFNPYQISALSHTHKGQVEAPPIILGAREQGPIASQAVRLSSAAKTNFPAHASVGNILAPNMSTTVLRVFMPAANNACLRGRL